MGHRTTYGAPLTLVWNFLLRSGSRYGAQGHLWGSLWGTGPSLELSMGLRAIYRALYGAQGHLWGSPNGSLCGTGPSMWFSMWLTMWHRSISGALYGAQSHLWSSLWVTGPSMGHRAIYGSQDHLWGPPHLGLELPLAVGQQIWGTGPSMGLSMGHRSISVALYVSLCGT